MGAGLRRRLGARAGADRPGRPLTATDELQADCGSCAALCCVVPAFARGADSTIDEPAGTLCPNLTGDDRCGVHDRLRPLGFAGCVVHDCFGAGQLVTGAGLDRRDGAVLHQVATVFPVVRALQELRWLVRAARAMDPPAALAAELTAAEADLAARIGGAPEELRGTDVDAVRGRVNGALTAAGAHARRSVRRPRDLRGADLVGAELRGADLRGAVRAQLGAASGDTATRLDDGLDRPAHWPATA